MLKAYRYRIYPNKEQEIQLAKTFGCCRFVYNQTLAYRKDAYEKEKKSVSKTDCNNYCNRELKKAYEWLKEVDKFALTFLQKHCLRYKQNTHPSKMYVLSKNDS